MKAPLTPKAAALLLGKLGTLRDEGHRPRDVIEQSIARGWKGFFPVDSRYANGYDRARGPPSWQQEQREKMADLTGRAKPGTIEKRRGEE